MLLFSIRPFQRKDNGGEIALSRKQLPTVLLETVSQIRCCSNSIFSDDVQQQDNKDCGGSGVKSDSLLSQGNSSFLFQ
jgi:hypothetical protein